MIVMDSTTQLKVDIITKVAAGKISIGNAAKLLNKSKITIKKYITQYSEKGIQFAIHKNCRKTPLNKINNATKCKTQKLIKEKYFDLNLSHLKKKLEIL